MRNLVSPFCEYVESPFPRFYDGKIECTFKILNCVNLKFRNLPISRMDNYANLDSLGSSPI
jgi:hypothetical protein